MTVKELKERLATMSDESQICVYEDSAYWRVSVVRSVKVVAPETRKEFVAVQDEVKDGDLVLSGYEE